MKCDNGGADEDADADHDADMENSSENPALRRSAGRKDTPEKNGHSSNGANGKKGDEADVKKRKLEGADAEDEEENGSKDELVQDCEANEDDGNAVEDRPRKKSKVVQEV